MIDIETERVFSRMFTMNDVDDFAPICANPQVMKYLGHDCKPVPREEVEYAIESYIKYWEKHGIGRWAIIYKENNKLIGCAGLRLHEGTPELVVLLDEPYWRKGLATEIGRAVLKYGFETRGFDRIIAMTRPANTGSRRLMNKLGMRFLEEAIVFGQYQAVIYEILREEYLNPAFSAFNQNSLAVQ
jgi:ribosomal-protein-alanine N-acetyltransferase